MPYLLIFSGLKPLPLNSLNPFKVTVPRDPFRENFDSGTDGPFVLNFCDISWVTPLFAAMEAALHRLAPLDHQQGAPWPHQMRQFLQEAIQILEETRVKRLDSEHYPTVQQFTNDCCADASAFLEMVEGWSCDWRVAFGAVHLAVAGLYAHPDLGAVRVAGVPVRGLVREILLFLAERGIAYGKLDAALSGTYENWEEGEHPSKALLFARPSINQLCRTILKAFFEEPECAHTLLEGRIVHYYDGSA
jgi:hypothetical protein